MVSVGDIFGRGNNSTLLVVTTHLLYPRDKLSKSKMMMDLSSNHTILFIFNRTQNINHMYSVCVHVIVLCVNASVYVNYYDCVSV